LADATSAILDLSRALHFTPGLNRRQAKPSTGEQERLMKTKSQKRLTRGANGNGLALHHHSGHRLVELMRNGEIVFVGRSHIGPLPQIQLRKKSHTGRIVRAAKQ
jgi:hypothetical protein